MSEEPVDPKKMSDKELYPHFEKWFNDHIIYHLILKKWIRNLGDEVNELGVPMEIVWVQLKAFTDFIGRARIDAIPPNDRFLLDKFTGYISENMEANSLKIQQAIEQASQKMDEEEGVYVPSREPRSRFDIKYQ